MYLITKMHSGTTKMSERVAAGYHTRMVGEEPSVHVKLHAANPLVHLAQQERTKTVPCSVFFTSCVRTTKVVGEENLVLVKHCACTSKPWHSEDG